MGRRNFYTSGENHHRFGVEVKGTETADKIRTALLKYHETNEAAEARKRSGERIRDRNSQEWVFTSPEGETVKLRNLEEFCRDRGLNPLCMSRVARGITRNHRGWRREGAVETPTKTSFSKPALLRMNERFAATFSVPGLADEHLQEFLHG